MPRSILLVTAALITLAAFCAPRARAADKKLIVFIAGAPSHEWGGHEHNAGCELLAKCLRESQIADQIEIKVYHNGWPKEPDALKGAAAIVMYCDGGNGHMVLKHLKEVDDLAKQGVGIGCIHYAVEPGEKPDDPNNGRAEFLRWIGGYFETFYSINPHWKADVIALPNHPVANGVHPFSTNDEWYYHMRFRENMAGVTPIVAAIPPDKTRQGKDDPHGGNAEVRKGIGKSLPEYTVWVSENPDPEYHGQRGFGCTGAHVHWNWAQDDFRKSILNAIVWTAHIEVPKDGVQSKRPTVQDLLANMDPKKRPPEKTDEWIENYIKQVNEQRPKTAAAER
jgi:type 1 glutamine amidotransferase